MVAGRVSIIVPARNERFLLPTVADLFGKARGDVEILVVLDGWWPTPPLPDDRRLRILHRGEARGMRPAINDAARVATGEYLVQCDAHVMVAEGWDVQLKTDYLDRSWVLIPRRYALEPETWTLDQSNPKYPVDYHFLSCPFGPTKGVGRSVREAKSGLHGAPWTERRDARADYKLDEEMSSQGSFWFMHRDQWTRIGEMDRWNYGDFVQCFQEIGLKAWLGGGAVMVTKNTWISHLYKGGKYHRGYKLDDDKAISGSKFCTWFWMTDQWPQRVRDLRWLVERFAPVPSWPADLDTVFYEAKHTLKNPYAHSEVVV